MRDSYMSRLNKKYYNITYKYKKKIHIINKI